MHEAVFKPLPNTPKQKSVKVVPPSKPIPAWRLRQSVRTLWALAQGLLMTGRHLLRKPVTFHYPNQKRPQSPRFRGIHKLQRFDDGKERCVGCGLCAVVCPSNAIYLEAQENTPENPVSHGERYASYYQIDMLRCIFCGFCEEACPEDAIILGPNWEAASADRQDFIYTKDRLLVPPEKKDDFRRGMTWPDREVETMPTSSDRPEYYRKLRKIG
ncbi:MAG: NADH-quinone oxidoreductase subunit NuoI [Candidatus Omnitrophota bacterium]|jgi:NADH-quinone oxidoreductase subunit I|nr:MAG: NADH-quinone oxidoreductase subunit NuoI [Candidatus Omnitrophota bacterium]